MSVDVLVGLQRGDEGKGRFVDMLADDYDIVARFNGGNNAGHTVVLSDEQVLKLHLVPSGITHPDTVNIIGNGTQGVFAHLFGVGNDQDIGEPAAHGLGESTAATHILEVFFECRFQRVRINRNSRFIRIDGPTRSRGVSGSAVPGTNLMTECQTVAQRPRVPAQKLAIVLGEVTYLILRIGREYDLHIGLAVTVLHSRCAYACRQSRDPV